eukprot:scaffold2381_cov128-Cylindrotheca_fusiformis.AAC.3
MLSRIRAALLLSVYSSVVSSFGSFETIPHHIPILQSAVSSIHASSDGISTSPYLEPTLWISSLRNGHPEVVTRMSLFAQDYQQALKTNPYETKIATGVVLAIIGDAIAQLREPASYDIKRATAFAAFDGFYRAVQQLSYPALIAHFQGQHILGALKTFGMEPTSLSSFASLVGPLEQTLVSQLVIIPTIYYPLFFSITGMIQGLTVVETIDRARNTFIPLMKRNLTFWIPVQLIAFGYIQEDLQIPVLIVCGLLWTIILSVSAGAVKPTVDDFIEDDMLPEVAMTKLEGSLGISPVQEREREERQTVDR